MFARYDTRTLSKCWVVLPNINWSFEPEHSNRSIMDTAASNASEATVRPKRHKKLPFHLDEYEVGYLPPVEPPPTASLHCHFSLQIQQSFQCLKRTCCIRTYQQAGSHSGGENPAAAV